MQGKICESFGFCANFLRRSCSKQTCDREKILGIARERAVAPTGPLNKFGPKYFSCNAKTPRKIWPLFSLIVKKFPGPRCVSCDAYYWPPPPPPPPGKWAPGPRSPAAVRECKRVGPQISLKISLVWSHARHTFCNGGKFQFFGGGVPVPLRSLGPLGGRAHGSPATALAWKKFCVQLYAWHTFCHTEKF